MVAKTPFFANIMQWYYRDVLCTSKGLHFVNIHTLVGAHLDTLVENKTEIYAWIDVTQI
jgi:hypothetical protein